MGVLKLFGSERVYTSIGLFAAAIVLVFMSYFMLPGSNLHGDVKLVEAAYLTLIFTIIVVVLYNLYYSLTHRKKKESVTTVEVKEKK